MHSFKGYPRADGGVGTRNHVAVLASVICSTTPVQAIADQVPGAVAIVHPLGCAQVGDDLRQTRRSLTGVAHNDNVASVLVVGLGCENNQPEELAALITSPKPVEVIGIQALGGSDKVIAAGTRTVGRWAEEAAGALRTQVPISRLHVGVLGVDWNPENPDKSHETVGAVVERLVDAGACVTLGVDQSLAPAGTELAARAVDAATRERLEAWGRGRERRRWQVGHSLDHHDWRSDEVRRALRLAPLTGRAQIQSVLEYSLRPEGPGLHLMQAPSHPVQAMAGLVAAGATIILVVSNRGILSGAVGAPTMVVVPRASQGSALDAAVDHYIDESVGVEAGAASVLERLIAIASGEPSRLEEAGLLEFAIPQVSTPF